MDGAGDDTMSRTGERLRRIEDDVHEEPTSLPLGARAGRRSGAILGAGSAIFFLLAVVLFFYSLGSC